MQSTAGFPHMAANLTFGRDAAQFHQLILFMALISLVLWGIVVFTLLLRSFARYAVYRPRRRLAAAAASGHKKASNGR